MAVSGWQPGPSKDSSCGRHTVVFNVESSCPPPGTAPLENPQSSARVEESPVSAVTPRCIWRVPPARGLSWLLSSGSCGPGEPLWALVSLGRVGRGRWGTACQSAPAQPSVRLVLSADHHARDEERLRGCRRHPGGLQSRRHAGQWAPSAVLACPAWPPHPPREARTPGQPLPARRL